MLKGYKIPYKRKSSPHTEEHKRNISESHKGEKNYWFGKTLTPEHKEKIRLGKLGKSRGGNPDNWKGHTPWNKGTKGVMKANSGSFKKGQHVLEKHPRWKGGISKLPSYDTFTTMRRRARKRQSGSTHTIQQWEELKLFYGFMCLCCKLREPEIKLTEDHIVPLSMGGSNDILNIQPLCLSCNVRKYTKTIDYRLTFVQNERV